MAKVTIERDCKDYLQMVFVHEDLRSTISLKHQDGLDLLARLQDYYSSGEMRTKTVRELAQQMIETLATDKASQKLIEMLQQADAPGEG